MAKTREVRLRLDQWQFLFEKCIVTSIPQEMGEEKYSMETQSLGNFEIQALQKVLREESHYPNLWGKDRVQIFGPKEEVEIKKDDDGRLKEWQYKDPSKMVGVRLSLSAINGASWIVFLSLFPEVVRLNPKDGSPMAVHSPVSSVVAVDKCWPIAEALKRAESIRSFLKIDRTRGRQWSEDREEDLSADADVGKVEAPALDHKKKTEPGEGEVL